MNIVNSGTSYQIYDDSVKTYQHLPVGCYQVVFNQMTGFSLIQHNNLKVLEDKIYGDTNDKVDKILKSFKLSDRNFGVILSGGKGVGKSLFAKVLANKANTVGLSLILVNRNYPGLADFISSIEDEAVVLFDEFEKNFAGDYNPEYDDDLGSNGGSQNDFLGLFDGVDSGKKLFVVTCNEVYKLSKYLINRPGRFHYHFRLQPPKDTEIEEYLKDKLYKKYYSVIPTIISLSMVGTITYDCLRAIAFDINQGYSLEETLECLNLTRDRDIPFQINVELSNNLKFSTQFTIDIFGDPCVIFLNSDNGDELKISLNPKGIKYAKGVYTIPLENVKVCHYYKNNDIDDVNAIPMDTTAKKSKKSDPLRITSIELRKVDEEFSFKYLI